ncbi:hypothetical protein GOC18_24565 [Sinorhizobium meliloti]|nr:hypothetical protein [Sinorhizobium meliloti]
MHHVSTPRLGGHLLRSGSGLLGLGLTSGLGFILHYFYVTPFEVCSAALATASVFDVWPWALPLLATEGIALTLIASGLCLISRSTRESAFSLHTHQRSVP